jgi:hypothetical protein
MSVCFWSTTAPPPRGRRGGITPDSSRAGQPRAGPLRVQIRVARHSFAQRPAGVFFVQSVGDAFVGEADEFGKRRVRAAGSARQRRNEAGQRRKGMAVERPKIDGLGPTARRTAHPEEPMPCLESAADRRREQHWHALSLPLVPRSNETARVFEDLSLGSALRRHLSYTKRIGENGHRMMIGTASGSTCRPTGSPSDFAFSRTSVAIARSCSAENRMDMSIGMVELERLHFPKVGRYPKLKRFGCGAYGD